MTGPVSHICDLPNELLYRILQEVLQDNLESVSKKLVDSQAANGPPAGKYLNRYTPSARSIRRVCRCWKELIDQPSSYHSRLTIAALRLDLTCSDAETFDDLKTFWTHLEQSKSLIAINMAIHPAASCFGSNSPGPSQHQFLKAFFLEMLHLTAYTDQLIRIQAFALGDTLSTHLIGFLASLGSLPSLFDLKITTHRVLIDRIRCDVVKPSTFPTSPAPTESGITFQDMCRSLSSLHRLTIDSACTKNAEIIPPGLTSLSLRVSSFNPAFLRPCASSLRDVKITVPGSPDAEQRWSNLSLDALTSMHLQGAPQMLRDMLLALRCPRLVHLKLAVIHHVILDPGTTISNPQSFPHLKTLNTQNFSTGSLPVLAALDIPNILTHFNLSDFQSLKLKEDEPVHHLTKLLEKIRTNSLHICTALASCSFFFQIYPYIRNVQSLRVTIEDAISETGDRCDFEIPSLELNFLAIDGEHLDYMAVILDKISTSNNLCTLDICHDFPLSREPYHLSQAWKNFASDISSQVPSRYSSVNTLVTKWPSPSAEFIPTLFGLTPNARTLVVKLLESQSDLELLDEKWLLPLAELHPTHAASRGKGVSLPSLESIVLEYQAPCTIDTLEHLRPIAEQMLPDLVVSRSSAGASSIHSVILKSFSKWEIPEVRSFAQECGVILQLEVVTEGS